MALTGRRLRFAEEYLVDLNGTQAAIRAGYAASRARSTASRLLTDPAVAAFVGAGIAARSRRTEISQDWVLERLKEVAERSLQHEPARDAEGNIVGDYSFAHAGANRALELLGKHLGMFRERVELGGPGGGPIETDNTLRIEFVRPKKGNGNGSDT